MSVDEHDHEQHSHTAFVGPDVVGRVCTYETAAGEICGHFTPAEQHSGSRHSAILAAEESALERAADALEFRLEWLGDYGQREYGRERAAVIVAETEAALKALREMTGDARPADRTMLVHLHVTLPADAPATAADVADEITAALEIAAEDPSGNAPALTSTLSIEVAMAEEI